MPESASRYILVTADVSDVGGEFQYKQEMADFSWRVCRRVSEKCICERLVVCENGE